MYKKVADKNNKGRVVVFIMPSLTGGGAERVMCILANYFSKIGYDVRIILIKEKIVKYDLDKRVKVICEFTESNRRKPIKRLINIRRYVKQNNNCILISFLTVFNLYGLLATRFTNTKVLISERNDPHKSISPKYNWARNFLYRYADGIVFQTEEAKDYFKDSITRKNVIIPNPLKEDLPQPYMGIRDKRVVTISRLSKQKNIPLLIQAFQLFHKVHPDYILEIYGEGPLEKEIAEYIKEIQLSNVIFLRGFTSDVHEKVLTAAMFVLSSDYEGLSNAMLEAMAIGLPCICTDCPSGGARSFIHDGENGLLVKVGDIGGMEEAMLKIVENKKLQMKFSEEASKIRAFLKEDIICEKWAKMLNEI